MGLITSNIRGRKAPVRVKRPGERRNLSRSATRALDVLELFGRVRQPLRAIDISKALQIHPSSTNQLLKTMVESAHLVFDARTKTYLPSLRLAQFSAWVAQTYGASKQLCGLIRDIHARTGFVVTITTPNDLFMQIVDSAIPEGHRAERGFRVSVFGSAIGSAYLSMLDDSEIVRLADRARIPTAEVPGMLESVARIRRDGYADGSIDDSNSWSIAMPLPRHGPAVPMVLGLTASRSQICGNHAEIRRIMCSAITRWISDWKFDR